MHNFTFSFSTCVKISYSRWNLRPLHDSFLSYSSHSLLIPICFFSAMSHLRLSSFTFKSVRRGRKEGKVLDRVTGSEPLKWRYTIRYLFCKTIFQYMRRVSYQIAQIIILRARSPSSSYTLIHSVPRRIVRLLSHSRQQLRFTRIISFINDK